MASAEVDRPVRTILRTRTIFWIILSGITVNFSAYAGNGFLVPMIQRYFGLELTAAAATTGFIVGVTGLVGLTAGGWLTDVIYQRWPSGRLVYGGACLALAAVATAAALASGRSSVALFASLFRARLAPAIQLLHQRLRGDPGRRRAAAAGDRGRPLLRRHVPPGRRFRPGGRRRPFPMRWRNRR